MTLNNCTVELGFNVSGSASSYFILDSATFGKLGTSRLSALTFTDITSYVYSVEIRRGRSRQLDSFNAGTANVVLNNRSRIFDPLNESSIFYPNISPRGYIRISCDEIQIFYGFINDWDISYDAANNDVVVAKCSDAFGILANQLLSAATPSAEKTGPRLNYVLDKSEVSYVGPREISTGLSTVGAYAIGLGTNVLNYMRQVEKSEVGNLFVDASGTVVFRQRGEFRDVGTIVFSDDGSGVPYETLDNQFGDELLYNYVRATSPAGAEQIRSNQTSIDLYQTSQLELDNLLNSSTTEVANIASLYLGRYKDPRVRLTSFSVQMRALSDANRLSVLGLELTDIVEVKKSFVVGSPSSFTQTSFVSGISHSIKPDSHRITFNIENAAGFIFLVLGNTVTGKLDYGAIDIG